MKKINNLKIKGIAYLVIGGLTLTTLTGCLKKKLAIENVSIHDLLKNNEIADETELDELVEAGMLDYDGNINYVQAADKLEKYIRLYNELSVIDLDQFMSLDSLTAQEQKDVLNIPVEYIENYKLTLSNHNKSYDQTQLKDMASKVKFLRNYYYEWIKKNGKDISINIMEMVIKSSLANEYGLDLDDYLDVVINERYTNNGNSDYGSISINNDKFNLFDADLDISKVTNYIYDLQSDNIDSDKELETYQKSIIYAKEILAIGIKIDGNKLVPKRSIDETNMILIK